MSGWKNIRLLILIAGAVCIIGQAQAAEFTADLFLANPGDSATARLYVRDHLYRIEKLEGKNKFLAIDNRLTDTTIAMNPEEMTYIYLAGPSGAFSNPIKGWEYMAKDNVEKLVGTEIVNGFGCDHYTYAYPGAESEHLETWISKKLNHFIKYVVHYDVGLQGSMEVRNVVEGPVDDAMFRIPDGYTRQKTAEEIELERPALSTTESTTAPAGRRLVAGGELIVAMDPELSTRVELNTLTRDSAICHVHLYKNGQRIELSKLPEPMEETFILASYSDRKQPLYGMQHEADEVRVKLDKGRIMATVFNEYSSFDDEKRAQYYISGREQGIGGEEGRPIHLKIVGDSPAGEISHVRVHAYERVFVDGIGKENTVEKLEFDLKNGEEKLLRYGTETKVNAVSVGVDDGGGVKVFLSQP